ncbi:MAG TPA: cupin domain-containing protein, partial [Candidatus Paceibacterota bacterium]|nr:cupin domain-containing protein [Candidatus Paceibacterota bacterium]
MKGFVADIEQKTLENTDFRRVLYTGKNSQLVVMSIPPGGEIGAEVHADVDQFLRLEQGTGKAVLDGVEHAIADKSAIVVPAGMMHNFINTGTDDMKLYSIYSPPEHKDGTVHR